MAPRIGVDEVGRGAWAGPFVACALLLDQSDKIVAGVRDSKLLSPKRRQEISSVLKERHQFAIGIVTVEELNTIGLGQAQVLVFERAVEGLVAVIASHSEAIQNRSGSPRPKGLAMTKVLIDGRPIRSHPEWTAIVDGDQKDYAIAAASIIAKVARDRMMRELHAIDERYRFDLHKGYGTALHRRLLAEHGASIHHRKLFEPIRSMLYS